MEKTEKQLVTIFAKKMQEKLRLRHDRYTPLSWKKLDMKRLLWLLQGEIDELRSMVTEPTTGNTFTDTVNSVGKQKAIKDNAIDIANYAMFIYCLHGHE